MANQLNTGTGYNYTMDTMFPIDYRQYRNFVSSQNSETAIPVEELLFPNSGNSTGTEKDHNVIKTNECTTAGFPPRLDDVVDGNFKKFQNDGLSQVCSIALTTTEKDPIEMDGTCEVDEHEFTDLKAKLIDVNEKIVLDASAVHRVEDASSKNEMPIAVECIKVEEKDDSEADEDTPELQSATCATDSEIDESSTEEEDKEDDPEYQMSSDKTPRKGKDASGLVKSRSKKAKQTEYRCKYCDRKLNSKRALQNHENLHVGKFSCSICNKYFNSKNSLEIHARIHEGFVGTETCRVCDKTFYDKSSLTKHTRSVHMGITNFQCLYCDKSFYARKTFEEHVRVHTGEKPFKCTLCPKSYKRGSDLNHHIRLHKGEVSHTCEFCGDGYRRISELNRHMQKHKDQPGDVVLPQKDKKCQSCGLRFSTQKALSEHINEHLMGNIQYPPPLDQAENRLISEKEKLVNEIVQELGNSGLAGNVRRDENSSSHHQESMQQVCLDIGRNSLLCFADCLSNNKPDSQSSVSSSKNKSETSGNVQKSENVDKTASGAPTSQGDVTMTEYSTVNANKIIYNEKADSLDNESDSQDKCALAVGDIKVEDEEYNEEDQDNHVTAFDPDSSSEDYAVEDQDLYDSDTDEYEPYCAKRKMRKAGPQKRQKKMVSKSEVKKEMCVESGSEQLSNTESKTKGRTKKGSLKPRKKCTRKKKKTTDGGSGAEEKEEDEEDKMFTVKIKTSEKFICEECGKSVSTKACLKKHMHLHAGTFTCGLCSKSFASQVSLNMHMDNHEGKKDSSSTCKVCDKVFYDYSSLNKHVKNVHMNYRPFPCPSCERRFSEKKTLVEHIRTHTGERPFSCELCGKSFKRVSELNFHKKKHTGETKLTCSECGKGFLRHSQLRHHQLMKHTEDKPFPCTFCGKRFGSNAGMKDHMLIHISQKDFECEKCGKGFNRKAKLNKHLNIKGDCTKNSTIVNGVYKCKYCFLEIDDYATLQKHVKEVHEAEGGEKLFHCKVCFKEFGRTQALKRHLKIHYNVRDYRCTICNATFIQQHHLKQHMRTHTGEKPFQCTICLRSFAQTSTLYSHMKHH